MIPALLGGYTKKVDGTLSLRFNTQELRDEQFKGINDLHQSYGVLYFTSNEKLTDNELKVLSELDTPKNEGKTPSQKLRNSIYVLWDKQGRPKEFCQFYENYIEEFRNRIIDQINKIEV